MSSNKYSSQKASQIEASRPGITKKGSETKSTIHFIKQVLHEHTPLEVPYSISNKPGKVSC
jgi:hypothetical protein